LIPPDALDALWQLTHLGWKMEAESELKSGAVELRDAVVPVVDVLEAELGPSGLPQA
jgi:hypothetical protein